MTEQHQRAAGAGRSRAILLLLATILIVLGSFSRRSPELSSTEIPGVGVITDYDFAVIESCGQCYYEDQSNEHIFGEIPWYSYQMMDCDAFNSCHSNPQQGLCENSHWPCSGLAALQRHLEDAIAENDGEGVAQLVYHNASLVQFD